MSNTELIENVVVYNGVEEHQLQYNYSPFRVKNLARWVLGEISYEFIKEINEKQIRVFIECDLEYSKAKFINLEAEERDLQLRFRELTREYCE